MSTTPHDTRTEAILGKPEHGATVLRDARSANDLMAYAKRLYDLLVAAHRQDGHAFVELVGYLIRTHNPTSPPRARSLLCFRQRHGRTS